MKRRTIVLIVVGVLIALAVPLGLKVQRNREWAHGGDKMAASVQTQLADQQSFGAVIGELGVPEDAATSFDKNQALVARISWTGSEQDDGVYFVMALDKRVSPPRVLTAEGGWTPMAAQSDSGGQLSSGWVSSYDQVLADHYDWLAGLKPGAGRPSGGQGAQAQLSEEQLLAQQEAEYMAGVSPAVPVPAAQSGEATVWFSLPDGVPALTDPNDVIVGVFYVSPADRGKQASLENQVRWAKRISG